MHWTNNWGGERHVASGQVIQLINNRHCLGLRVIYRIPSEARIV